MMIRTATQMLPFRTRYALGERLGVGATAEVYRCTHRASRRTYACKVINKARLSGAQLSDLRAEVDAMGALNHHSIVHLKVRENKSPSSLYRYASLPLPTLLRTVCSAFSTCATNHTRILLSSRMWLCRPLSESRTRANEIHCIIIYQP